MGRTSFVCVDYIYSFNIPKTSVQKGLDSMAIIEKGIASKVLYVSRFHLSKYVLLASYN
jgi:hypothetical protein